MRIGSKRWHRARRRKWRRGSRIARRIVLVTGDHLATEGFAERYNRAVRWLNRRLATARDGLPLCDGIVECPKCGRTLPMMADPQEWQRPLHKLHRWEVTGYWGGTAQCCDLLIADNFDRTEVYDLSRK